MVALQVVRIKQLVLRIWRLDTLRLTLLLAVSWLVVAVLTLMAGYLGQLWLPLYWLLTFPALLLILIFKSWMVGLRKRTQWLLMFGLIGIWLLHAVGIMVPETGFDAIWYHLPVIKRFLELGQIVYISEYYQSLNPFFSDALLLLGFQAAGTIGAKVVAYLLGLSLLVTCYQLARLWLNRFWSLWLVITISLIQPIAWQVSSAYIDVAKAYWEVAMMLVMMLVAQHQNVLVRKILIRPKWLLVFAGLLAGASLGTKLFSILLIPPLVVMVPWLRGKLSDLGWFFIPCLVLAAPFYIFSWLHTGDPWFGISVPMANLGEIGGEASARVYFMERVRTLPLSWWYLVVQARDYVSILLLIWLPVLVMFFAKRRPKTVWLLTFFAASQYAIWWFVPPVSTRYALSGFIILLVVYFLAAAEYSKSLLRWGQLALVVVLVVASTWHLLPRLIVIRRSARYILGQQDQLTYLRQFADGTIDHHLEKWYQLELD